MAVDENTYGTLNNMQTKVGWVVDHRKFSNDTDPKRAEVETMLDQKASEIHMALQEAGYPIKTKAWLTTNAPRVATWLERLNEAGAAADIVNMFAVAGDTETDRTPGGYWNRQWERGLKQIKGTALTRMDLARENELSSLLVCTSVEDEDGNEKEPFFTRKTFEYPSAHPIGGEEES